MNICTCITESLCYTPGSNTTLKGNYTPIKLKKKKKKKTCKNTYKPKGTHEVFFKNCDNLEGWDEVGDGRGVKEGRDICMCVLLLSCLQLFQPYRL